ncbi:MAG: hypothetical protein WBB86_05665 [Candidatus Omnitrophota bacterium]
MNRIQTIFFTLIFCIFTVFSGLAESGGWKNVFKIVSGNILCIETVDGSDVVYMGAEKGLYKSTDAGGNWEKISIPGEVSSVKDIAVSGEEVIITAEGGIYIAKGGVLWERIPGKKKISGITFYRSGQGQSAVLAWGKNDLFKIKDNDWERIGSSSLWSGGIIEAVCGGGVIFVISGNSIFRSPDGGDSWEEIMLTKERGYEEEIIAEDEEEFLLTGDIAPDEHGGILAATTRGVFIIDREGDLRRRIDTTGLPSTRVRYVTRNDNGIFAATDKKVFRYSEPGKSWQTVFEAFSGTISLLDSSVGSDGRGRLWTSNGRSLFRRDSAFPEESKLGKRDQDPPIREVHRMAVDYAEVSPEKIKRWRAGARWKALLPKFSFGVSESKDDKVEIYTSSTRSSHYTAPSEIDSGWDIDLTWDLSDLVWNDVQTNIDIRSKLMVQLRDEILEDVTRLYFERKRLLAELSETGPEDTQKLREKRLRAEELTAHIDALTGGRFSDALKSR